MPAIVVRRGRKFVVMSHRGRGGKKLGEHTTKSSAEAQKSAVNISLHARRRGRRR